MAFLGLSQGSIIVNMMQVTENEGRQLLRTWPCHCASVLRAFVSRVQRLQQTNLDAVLVQTWVKFHNLIQDERQARATIFRSCNGTRATDGDQPGLLPTQLSPLSLS